VTQRAFRLDDGVVLVDVGVFRDLHDQAFERHAKCYKTVDPGRIHQDLGAGVRGQVGGVG
jgi:hypothetical protein